MWEVVEYWRDWKRFGVWPYEGEALDQPATVFEAVRALDDAANEATLEKQGVST